MSDRRRTDYLRELRANRKWHFDRNVADVLLNAGVDPRLIEPIVLREMRNLQNRTRGQLFELMGEVLLVNQYRENATADGHSPEIGLVRQCRFVTPLGERRVDLYAPAERAVLEVKSGYVTLCHSIREQIAKDRWLLENSADVQEVIWFLFRGGSYRLVAALEDARIKQADLQWDRR